MTEQKPALAEIAYDAYGNWVGWKNYAGLPMPRWEELGDTIRGAWGAAAAAIESALAPPPASSPAPTLGRIVHYQLSDVDAEDINRRRADAEAYRGYNSRGTAGRPGATGHVAHVGNRAEAGQKYPATVVRTFGGTAANLQVHLDGTDTHWATSRGEGDQPGQWSWPPRV